MKNSVRTTVEDIAGAFGDFGTIIPLILAAATVGCINFGYTLLFFGIWFVITGLYYRLPIPVEPMKAVAVIAIAGAMSIVEVAAAGLILGFIFLILGTGSWLQSIERYIPECIIRGVQLGLALLLVKSAVPFITGDLLYFIIGIGFVLIFYLLKRFAHFPDLSAIAILVAGFGSGIILQGIPVIHLLPKPEMIIPSPILFLGAAIELVIPQTLLTITNAILATSLLIKDLYARSVPPRKLSMTIGLMNLSAAPFGAFPLCHGAGGLASQYRYGARTGRPNIIAGIFFLIIALFFASPETLSLISGGLLGTLLVFSGIEMATHGVRSDYMVVTCCVAVLSLFISMTIAFVIGMVLYYLILYKRKGAKSQQKFHPPGSNT